MRTDYEKRMILPLAGQPDVKFFTSAGTLIATGYERIVIGGRGPYIEFQQRHMNMSVLAMPEQRHVYFHEFRSVDDSYVMVYFQRRLVRYANYRKGLWYVSPFELTSDRYPKLVTV